jgi:NAD(P)-dependent dehydrogenase (short-subunit alcohol dehydrogenase family)
MELRMKDTKSIVITGASSGIGAALTSAFANDGHRLFVCARRIDRLSKAIEGLPSVFHASCDVGSEPDVKEFFAQIRAQTTSIDVLIHCAAVMGPIGLVTDIDSEEWLAALKTDLFGAFLVTKHAVPLMRSERRPRILLMSGGGAFDPMPNLTAYGVAKAGIIRFAESLAVELAPRNIAVNVFAPGFVATEIFDTLLEAGPERGGEIYRIVVKLLAEWGDSDIELPLECARFLISDAAAPLTGKTISARHDPWDEPEFIASLPDIVASKLYSTQRTNIEHLEGKEFIERLADAAKNRARRKAGTSAKSRDASSKV